VSTGQRLRALLWPSVAALCALALLLGLGFWQLHRLGEKQALIARIEARIHQVPEAVPPTGDWPKLNLAALEYRPVKLHGTYLHDKEILVFEPAGKVAGELTAKGYLVLTPLHLNDGGIVIINRGFVTDDKAAPASRAAGQIAGETDVTGLLRLPQPRNFFTPADEPEKNLWFTSDPAAIAKAKGLANLAPFLVDADATANPGGWPQGGTTEISIPNRHLEYAVTWFGLALTLLGVYAFFARALWLRPRQNTYPDHVL
jgi:surfeit locus 1 family protein